MQQLPELLIIGAEKSGTTTLYKDLEATGAISFAEDKEPRDLVSDEVLTSRGTARYASKFSPSRGQVACDASTDYSKRTEYAGVPDRALAVLGSTVNIVYLLRNPIDRALSHHRHQFAMGLMPESFDDAVTQFPKLIDNGRYSFQLEPWIDVFGSRQIHLVCFEEFVADRPAMLRQLGRVLKTNLAIDHGSLPPAQNVSTETHFAYGPWRRIALSNPYQRLIRPLMTPAIRKTLRSKILRQPIAADATMSCATRTRLAEVFRDDAESLATQFPEAGIDWELS